jgi:hypothetical protein
MQTFQLGQRAKDLVTDVTGIVIGYTTWLNGCVQYIIKPPLDKDGKQQDAMWVDWQQLVAVDDGIAAHVSTQRKADPARSGGPSPRMAKPNAARGPRA